MQQQPVAPIAEMDRTGQDRTGSCGLAWPGHRSIHPARFRPGASRPQGASNMHLPVCWQLDATPALSLASDICPLLLPFPTPRLLSCNISIRLQAATVRTPTSSPAHFRANERRVMLCTRTPCSVLSISSVKERRERPKLPHSLWIMREGVCWPVRYFLAVPEPL